MWPGAPRGIQENNTAFYDVQLESQHPVESGGLYEEYITVATFYLPIKFPNMFFPFSTSQHGAGRPVSIARYDNKAIKFLCNKYFAEGFGVPSIRKQYVIALGY